MGGTSEIDLSFPQNEVWIAFSINKLYNNLKTALYIYTGYLCLILKIFDGLKHENVTNMQKKKRKRQILFHCVLLWS